MLTTDVITIINNTGQTLTLDKEHLHINHYNAPARQTIEEKLENVFPGKSNTASIVASGSSDASTIEMSFHMLNISKHDAVRFYLKQQGSTVPSISKNQLSGYKAATWVDKSNEKEPKVYFEVSLQ